MMKNRNQEGFSMIEVMVAATILVVIVMMLGMLFQQTSVAWRTGLMRSEGYMQLRAYIGAVQRDASLMVDANQIPKDLLCSNQKQEFKKDSIRFYTVSGGMKTASGGTMEDYRTLNFITYDIDGTRTQRRLKPNGTWSAEERADILAFINDVQDKDKPQVVPTGFIVAFSDVTERDGNGNAIPNANRYPLYVTVESELTQRGQLYDVGAECAGPDKQFGSGPLDRASKDDVRTWVQ